MPFYNYKAKNSSGQPQKGKVEAVSEAKAAETLQERGFFVISLTPVVERSSLLSNQKQVMSFADTVIFTRQLASMIEAGLTLTNSLSLLIQQVKPSVRAVLGQILNDIESGMSFTKALEKHPKAFSKTYIYLVQAGESSGSLDIILNRLADTIEEQKEFRGKIISSLIYPAVVLLVMIAVGAIMMIVVVPKLIGIFEEFEAKLPLPTLILIGLSNFLVSYWWLMLIFIVVAVAIASTWYRSADSKRLVDKWLFKIPVIGELRKKTILTDFSQTLSLLVRSGVPLVDSLNLATESMGSINYRDYMHIIKDKVEKGVAFGEALSAYEDFPPIMTQMITVGEETGKLDDLLARLGRYFKGEAQRAVAALMSAFEPLLMVILGIAVAFLVIAIILPIYDLTGQIG